jgi:hypothetical protein
LGTDIAERLIKLINAKVGFEMMNHDVAVRVITEMQTEQNMGVKKYNKKTFAEKRAQVLDKCKCRNDNKANFISRLNRVNN